MSIQANITKAWFEAKGPTDVNTVVDTDTTFTATSNSQFYEMYEISSPSPLFWLQGAVVPDETTGHWVAAGRPLVFIPTLDCPSISIATSNEDGTDVGAAARISIACVSRRTEP